MIHLIKFFIRENVEEPIISELQAIEEEEAWVKFQREIKMINLYIFHS